MRGARPLSVQLIAKPGRGVTGTSRYAENLYQGLRTVDIEVNLAFPRPIPLWRPLEQGFKRVGLDIQAFFSSYPLSARPANVDLYHLTTQTFATLLNTQHFNAPVVVTVLDILPYLARTNPRFNEFRHLADYTLYRFALDGLKKAAAIIAISEYTRCTLIDALGIPGDRITVVYPQIDLSTFRPQSVPEGFLAKYGLKRAQRTVLYVGSNDPRKNFAGLLEAFGKVRPKLAPVKLIKIGPAPFGQEQARMREMIARLGLQEHVLFFEDVPDPDLALFYNLADVFVFPSFLEGYGLPVVEAMACGTPVVSSRATSLAEVSGNAARLIDPAQPEMLALAIAAVMEDSRLRDRMREEGFRQVALLDAKSRPEMVCEVYRKVVG